MTYRRRQSASSTRSGRAWERAAGRIPQRRPIVPRPPRAFPPKCTRSSTGCWAGSTSRTSPTASCRGRRRPRRRCRARTSRHCRPRARPVRGRLLAGIRPPVSWPVSRTPCGRAGSAPAVPPAPARSGTAASSRCPRARRCGSARHTGRLDLEPHSHPRDFVPGYAITVSLKPFSHGSGGVGSESGATWKVLSSSSNVTSCRLTTWKSTSWMCMDVRRR